VHGYGGDQGEMLPLADSLARAGFGVLTYDSRGSGRSAGSITFGARETEDLIHAVDYLTRRRDVDPYAIGALGFSMGGATTLMAGARDPRIKAVVADSAWATADGWLRPQARDGLLHPYRSFSPLSLRLVELRTGIRFDRLKPVDVISHIGPRPVLLIHGDADTAVPPAEGDRNFAAAVEPKELWRIPGGKHGDTIDLAVSGYSERVVSFFYGSLASRGASDKQR